MASKEPKKDINMRTNTPEYITFRTNFDSLVNGVKSSITTIANSAFTKELITHESLSSATNGNIDELIRATNLLKQILEKIKGNYAHYYTFVKILETEPSFSDIAEKLNKELIKEHALLSSKTDGDSGSQSAKKTPTPSLAEKSSNALSFQCHCGSNCSLDTYVRGECRGQLEMMFPFLNVDALQESDKEKLMRKLVLEANNMIKEFEELTDSTFESLHNENTSVSRVIEIAVQYGESLPRPYQGDHSAKLSSLTTISNVHSFLVSHKYISFFNYRILEKIIVKVGTTKNKEKLAAYLEKFREFCKRSVFEVPSSIYNNAAPSHGKNLVVKVNEKVWFHSKHKSLESDFTVEDVYAVENEIALRLGVDPTYILLRDIKEGCVELSFIFLHDCQTSIALELLDFPKFGIYAINKQGEKESKKIDKEESHTSSKQSTWTSTNLKTRDMEPIFVEDLLSKYKCKKCKQVLPEACFTDCCNELFCLTCLVHEQGKKQCPHCGDKDFTHTHIQHKEMMEEINEMMVYYSKREKGCGLVMKFGELEKHLSIDNKHGCGYVHVKCPDCNEPLLRKDMEDHRNIRCVKRTTECQYCGKTGFYYYITNYHLREECQECPVRCPNGCDQAGLKQKDLKKHRRDICPLEKVDCPLQEVGCDKQFFRKDLKSHKDSSKQEHLTMLWYAYNKMKISEESFKMTTASQLEDVMQNASQSSVDASSLKQPWLTLKTGLQMDKEGDYVKIRFPRTPWSDKIHGPIFKLDNKTMYLAENMAEATTSHNDTLSLMLLTGDLDGRYELKIDEKCDQRTDKPHFQHQASSEKYVDKIKLCAACSNPLGALSESRPGREVARISLPPDFKQGYYEACIVTLTLKSHNCH